MTERVASYTFKSNRGPRMNGQDGLYGKPESGKDKNLSSALFGKNASKNFTFYVQDIPRFCSELTTQRTKGLTDKNEIKRIEDETFKETTNYNLQYLPEDKVDPENINKMALFGEAYEDLGGETMSVKDFDKNFIKMGQNDFSAAALDLNNDGKIDFSENAAYTLAQDMLDTQDPDNKNIDMDAKDVDGHITRNGEGNALRLLKKGSVKENKALLQQIYDHFKLGDSKKEFNDLLSKNELKETKKLELPKSSEEPPNCTQSANQNTNQGNFILIPLNMLNQGAMIMPQGNTGNMNMLPMLLQMYNCGQF